MIIRETFVAHMGEIVERDVEVADNFFNPPAPTPEPTDMLTQADIAEALLDLDYRTSLLEMGVN